MSWIELQRKNVRPRKDRKCIWCGENIPAKTLCAYVAGVGDGFQADYWHLECELASMDYDFMENDDSFPPHAFRRGTTIEKWEHMG
jgi:hypothetical protein